MSHFYAHKGVEIYCGSVLEFLPQITSESVHCVVTSPPYWGLRDYGVAGQFGLEDSLGEYIAKMVNVFEEVRRVLRNDGTLWLNMGDSYTSGGGTYRIGASDNKGHHVQDYMARMKMTPGLKPKDLIGTPWMLAFALRSAGWYLRSDIIWHKPNPMPESVSDRPTKAHEYLFLFSKSERYYYNAEAIKEKCSEDTHASYGRAHAPFQAPGQPEQHGIAGKRENTNNGKRPSGVNPKARLGKEGINSRMHQDRDPQHASERKSRKDAGREAQGLKDSTRFGRGAGWRNKQNESFSAAVKDVVEFRNKRTVWTIATQPYSGAHFATFPEKLVEPCIKAGCPEGGLVLDPFAGSGTVLQVAKFLGRKAIGIELKPEYCRLMMKRLAQDVLRFESDNQRCGSSSEEGFPSISVSS